jgi:hypothetical protein
MQNVSWKVPNLQTMLQTEDQSDATAVLEPSSSVPLQISELIDSRNDKEA